MIQHKNKMHTTYKSLFLWFCVVFPLINLILNHQFVFAKKVLVHLVFQIFIVSCFGRMAAFASFYGAVNIVEIIAVMSRVSTMHYATTNKPIVYVALNNRFRRKCDDVTFVLFSRHTVRTIYLGHFKISRLLLVLSKN